MLFSHFPVGSNVWGQSLWCNGLSRRSDLYKHLLWYIGIHRVITVFPVWFKGLNAS